MYDRKHRNRHANCKTSFENNSSAKLNVRVCMCMSGCVCVYSKRMPASKPMI